MLQRVANAAAVASVANLRIALRFMSFPLFNSFFVRHQNYEDFSFVVLSFIKGLIVKIIYLYDLKQFLI